MYGTVAGHRAKPGKAAYMVLADSPEQDARYRKLLDLFEGEPEWHDGEIIDANPLAQA